MEEFEPAKTYTITDLETLRTLSEPLRMQILEIVLSEPCSVKQIGERLGLAPSRLYYHINQLEKFGLIRVVETRMVANMVEKIYRAVATGLEIAPGLLNFSDSENREAVTDVILSHLDATREDLHRSLQARQLAMDQGAATKPRTLIVNRAMSVIPDDQAEEFARRLHDLIQEFGQQEDVPGENTHMYAMTVAFYPAFYYSDKETPG